MANRVVICGINTATLPKITEKEADELLRKIADGDKTARETFAIANKAVLDEKRFGRYVSGGYDGTFESDR